MIGDIFDGRYRIIRLLGKGGMGAVYEAEQLETGKLVALKCIDGILLIRSSSGAGRFRREAKAMGSIDTDHIVRVLDAGTDPKSNAPYMVMELLEGEDLQHLLDRVGKLEVDAALRIAAQACIGLQKAHEAHIVHRDIKPANIFLARGAEGEIIVKILDFGVAKIKPEPNQGGPTTGLTRTGSIVGSPLYMSPEQARGLSDIDYSTDLWSLGMVLYRALAGKLPHEHIEAFGDLIIAICSQRPRPIQDLAPWVSPEAAAVVHGALKLDAGDRFPTAAAMLDAIRALLPNGSALRDDLLVPVSEATRSVSAPKLLMTHAPDDAHRRLARITALAGVSVDEEAPTEEVAHAAQASPAVGTTTTAEAIVTRSVSDGEVTSPAKGASDQRALPRARWAVPVAVGLLFIVGFVAFRYSRAPSPEESVSMSEAAQGASAAVAPPTASAESAPPAAERPPALHQAKLAVSPAGVSVEIDGKPAAVEGGKVALEGALGSRHQVRVRKGKQERSMEVIITDTGASPDTIELEAAKPRAAGPQAVTATATATATAQPIPPKPPETDDSMVPDKFK